MNLFWARRNLLRGQHGRNRVSAARWVGAQDLALALAVRISDPKPHQEAVELGFGKRVCTVVLDRILRRDHHERVGKDQRPAIDGDLAVVHGLEQSAIGFLE